MRGRRELGYTDVSEEDLVSMRLHEVSLDYAKKRMKARFKHISVDDYV